MRTRLARVLARQWIAFSLLLFAGFAAMAVLLLYLLEDSFIDARLAQVGAEVAAVQTPRLPPGFTLYREADAPLELREHMHGRRVGGIREFRMADGRYLHALAGRTDTGDDFLLAYDVSDQLKVNAAFARAWPWLLAIGLLLTGVAYLLARRFMARIAGSLGTLVTAIGSSADPTRLQALAAEERIAEFSELAALAAAAWESRLALLERERETLAFLGHELRTPLQSARTSLALLEQDRGNVRAWQRLERAQQRLARASTSVLWLSAETSAAAIPPCLLRPLVEALLDEFAPLAESRDQRLEVYIDGDPQWPLPGEVIETVLANLLLNAIQHGGAGVIRVAVDDAAANMDNPAGSAGTDTGFALRENRFATRENHFATRENRFGLGLQLVERLLQRFGWRVSRVDGERVNVQIRNGAAEESNRHD